MYQGLSIHTTGPIRWIKDSSFGDGDYGLMLVVYHGKKLGYARVGAHVVHVYLGVAITLLKFVVGFEIFRRI